MSAVADVIEVAIALIEEYEQETAAYLLERRSDDESHPSSASDEATESRHAPFNPFLLPEDIRVAWDVLEHCKKSKDAISNREAGVQEVLSRVFDLGERVYRLRIEASMSGHRFMGRSSVVDGTAVAALAYRRIAVEATRREDSARIARREGIKKGPRTARSKERDEALLREFDQMPKTAYQREWLGVFVRHLDTSDFWGRHKGARISERRIRDVLTKAGRLPRRSATT